MVSTDETMRERATLLAELWSGESGRTGANGTGGTNGANGANNANGLAASGSPVAGALAGRLLRTREVALLFQVSERAVTDWARRGRLPSVRTPGGHRRYPATAVRDLLESVGLRPR